MKKRITVTYEIQIDTELSDEFVITLISGHVPSGFEMNNKLPITFGKVLVHKSIQIKQVN